MEMRSDSVEPFTPGLTFNDVSFWRAEDSGYHTSFTPGSMECSEVSNENINPNTGDRKLYLSGQIHVGITPEVSLHINRKFRRIKSQIANESLTSPIIRRGIKRPFQEINDNLDSTPTSIIAGGIQRLKVNESCSSFGSNSPYWGETSDLSLNDYTYLSFPSTPVKKICRSSCNLSPRFNGSHKSSPLRATSSGSSRKSAKKLNFAIHSLSCETRGLQKATKHKPKVVRTIQFRPDQKVDIIKMLYQKVCCLPAISTILSYLSNADVYNFSLVSPTWFQVCEDVNKAKQKIFEHQEYLKRAKENQENSGNNLLTPKVNDIGQMRSLKEIHNVLNTSTVKSISRSPPGTPRSRKFKRFAKSASLDTRIQLSCVRCQLPAKVTEELDGEEWAECVGFSCAFQFCRFCKCERHTGKKCFRYDLDAPSPSKRKKTCAVGSKNSRKNLRRLL